MASVTSLCICKVVLYPKGHRYRYFTGRYFTGLSSPAGLELRLPWAKHSWVQGIELVLSYTFGMNSALLVADLSVAPTKRLSVYSGVLASVVVIPSQLATFSPDVGQYSTYEYYWGYFNAVSMTKAQMAFPITHNVMSHIKLCQQSTLRSVAMRLSTMTLVRDMYALKTRGFVQIGKDVGAHDTGGGSRDKLGVTAKAQRSVHRCLCNGELCRLTGFCCYGACHMSTWVPVESHLPVSNVAHWLGALQGRRGN